MHHAPLRSLSTQHSALSTRLARAELLADAALLDAVRPGGPGLVRWYVVDRPALVPGFAQRARVAEVVDEARCRERGVEVLERRAGGGLVLLDPAGMLCLALALPAGHPLLPDDLTLSYRWLGEGLARGLRALGVPAERVEVAEARAATAALAADAAPVTPLVRPTCYGTLSPHEVVEHGTRAKLVGLAQVRRREGALFQVGLLLRDQSALADLVRLPPAGEPLRYALRAALARRTVGLDALLGDASNPASLVRALEPFVLGASGNLRLHM